MNMSPPWLCEVHLWSEHLAVMAGRPFCGSDKNCVTDAPPPLTPTEGLKRPIQFGPMRKQEMRGGGLRTALLLVFRFVDFLHNWKSSTSVVLVPMVKLSIQVLGCHNRTETYVRCLTHTVYQGEYFPNHTSYFIDVKCHKTPAPLGEYIDANLSMGLLFI